MVVTSKGVIAAVVAVEVESALFEVEGVGSEQAPRRRAAEAARAMAAGRVRMVCLPVMGSVNTTKYALECIICTICLGFAPVSLLALTVLSLHSQCCSPACTRELSGLPLGNTNTYAADHSPLPHTDERT